MKITEKFMSIMKMKDTDAENEYEEEYDDILEEEDEEEYFEEEEVEEEFPTAPKPEKAKSPFFSFKHSKKEEAAEEEEYEETPGRVLPFTTRVGESDIVRVIKPQEFGEAQIVAELLKEGKTIVVNLEGIEISQAQRIIDFIGGASYAVDGTLKAISTNIFIVAPGNIEVSGDLRNEIISDKMISPDLTNY